jgi:hypothetical protein
MAVQLYIRGTIRGERANSLGVVSQVSTADSKVRFTFFDDPDGRKWDSTVSLVGAKFWFDADRDRSTSDLPQDGSWRSILKIELGPKATLLLAGRFIRPN